jgi:uncharacterized protein YdaT
MKRNQHVVPHHGEWAVRGEGNKRLTKITKTQKEAIEVAERIAMHQKTIVKIHNENGKIIAGENFRTTHH